MYNDCGWMLGNLVSLPAGDLFRDMLASFLLYHMCIIQIWKEVEMRDAELSEAKKNPGSSEPHGMAEDNPN